MILFYHIPKTAGISVVRAAREAMHGRERRILLTEMDGWLQQPQRWNAELADVAFLSGHFGYGVHRFLSHPPQMVTFLRHPVEQTISMHAEAQKRPDIYPSGELDALLSGSRGEPYFGNAQVRHLASDSGSPIVGPVNLRHLARAKEVISDEMTSFGITEFFAASLSLINHHLSTDLAPRRANTSVRPAASEIDRSLLLSIQRANTLDTALYEHACRLFMERLGALGCAGA